MKYVNIKFLFKKFYVIDFMLLNVYLLRIRLSGFIKFKIRYLLTS